MDETQQRIENAICQTRVKFVARMTHVIDDIEGVVSVFDGSVARAC